MPAAVLTPLESAKGSLREFWREASGGLVQTATLSSLARVEARGAYSCVLVPLLLVELAGLREAIRVRGIAVV